jgi:hypothetical protein
MKESSVDPALRAELEAVYNQFITTLKDADLERILDVLKMSLTDEEVFRKTAKLGDWDRHIEWMRGTNPELSQTTFVTLASLRGDYAGYYFLWDSPYSEGYQFLSIRRFQKIKGQWKMLYSLGGGSDAILQYDLDDDVQAKVYATLESNPLLTLEPPEEASMPSKGLEQTLEDSRGLKLKAELERVDETQRDALRRKDLSGYLSTVSISEENGECLKTQFRKVADDLLASRPMLSQTVYVATYTIMDGWVAGYYYVAEYPYNKAFMFVYLKMFVKREGCWRMLVNLDPLFKPDPSALERSGGDRVKLLLEVSHNNVATGLDSRKDGDLQTRALDLIDRNLLSMKLYFPLCYEAAIRTEVLAALEREDFPTVLTLSRPFLEQGSAWAETIVGRLYFEGKGVEKNFSTGLRLFRNAAENGDAEGLYWLAKAYFQGFGVEIDPLKALAYLILAAERGHLSASREKQTRWSSIDNKTRAKVVELLESLRSGIRKKAD